MALLVSLKEKRRDLRVRAFYLIIDGRYLELWAPLLSGLFGSSFLSNFLFFLKAKKKENDKRVYNTRTLASITQSPPKNFDFMTGSYTWNLTRLSRKRDRISKNFIVLWQKKGKGNNNNNGKENDLTEMVLSNQNHPTEKSKWGGKKEVFFNKIDVGGSSHPKRFNYLYSR